MISVIIPTLNDTLHLARTLDTLARYREQIEVLVVDGGSRDGLADLLEKYPWVRSLDTEPGRARQMNAGASAASGNVLLFLHADTRLESDWPDAVEKTFTPPNCTLGAFRLHLDHPSLPFRLIEAAVQLRSALFQLPYGDQALFMRRTDFERVGGYPDLPLMEDVELVRRLRRIGRVRLIPHRALSSARNWERDGLARRTLANWRTNLLHRCGAPMKAVLRSYRGARRAVVVFCKEPVPGQVKTRLAATRGPAEATAIYRELTRQTLDAATDCPGSPAVIVCGTPAGAMDRIRNWLGHGFRYMAQAEGNLGAKMLEAFRTTLATPFDEVVLIGTDCPALQSHHLAKAFQALRHNDVVLGPTDDGGYYLIGARAAHAGLFDHIPWSTEQVLSCTVKALEAHGLRYKLIEQLRDLDDEDDYRHHIAAGHLTEPAKTP